jgi:ribokinase
VVTGGIHYDVLVRLPRLPQANDRLGITGMTLAPGGMGGNVAAAIARLGGRVRFAGFFASDADGIALRRDLEADGVDCAFATERPGESWRGFILVGEAGQRAILGGWPNLDALERGIGLEVQPRKQRWQAYLELMPRLFDSAGLFDGADGVALPSNFAALLLPMMPPHLPVFIDVETGHFDHTPVDLIWETLCRATVVYANETNLCGLAERLGVGDIATLAELIGGVTVQTLGEQGCRVFAHGSSVTVPGVAVEAVDTTGAGDAFAGAFTLATLRGLGMSEAARFANEVAAQSVTGLGSRVGLKALTPSAIADTPLPLR